MSFFKFGHFYANERNLLQIDYLWTLYRRFIVVLSSFYHRFIVAFIGRMYWQAKVLSNITIIVTIQVLT